MSLESLIPTGDNPPTKDEYNKMRADSTTERQFQAFLVPAAQRLGWLVYHTYDSRRSAPGYPDLHLVHEDRGISILRELKTQKGRLSPDQKTWIQALTAAGVDVAVWRPIDWFDGSISKILYGPEFD